VKYLRITVRNFMADNVAKQMLLAQEERAKGRFAAGAF